MYVKVWVSSAALSVLGGFIFLPSQRQFLLFTELSLFSAVHLTVLCKLVLPSYSRSSNIGIEINLCYSPLCILVCSTTIKDLLMAIIFPTTTAKSNHWVSAEHTHVTVCSINPWLQVLMM